MSDDASHAKPVDGVATRPEPDEDSRCLVRRIVMWVLLAAAAVGGFALACHWDRAFHDWAMSHRTDWSDRHLHWWGAVFNGLQQVGRFPVWLGAAVILLVIDWRKHLARGWRTVTRRAALLLAAVACSGLAAEVMKLLVRRARPPKKEIAWDGVYVFRSFSESGRGLGLPSSHAAVAFGGAWMLCCLYPRLAPLWILIGAGVAFIRAFGRSHFLSDTFAGAVLAAAVVWLLWRAAQNRWPEASLSPDGAT